MAFNLSDITNVDKWMKGFGAKDPTTTQTQASTTSDVQQDFLKKAGTDLGTMLSGMKKSDISTTGIDKADMPSYTAPGMVAPGVVTKDQGGYGGIDESGVSLAGLDKLKTTEALGGLQSQISGLQEVGGTADYGARRDRAMVAAQRGLTQDLTKSGRATSGGGAKATSAYNEATGADFEKFGQAVANATAQYEFDSRLKADELKLKGLEASGRLAASGMTIDVDAAAKAGTLEHNAFAKAGDLDMQNWKNLMDGSVAIDQNSIKNAMAEVDAAYKAGDLTLRELQIINQSILMKDKNYTDAQVQGLTSLGAMGTAPTMENIIKQDPGSAGLLPSLIEGGSNLVGLNMLSKATDKTS